MQHIRDIVLRKKNKKIPEGLNKKLPLQFLISPLMKKS
jgi:hypothetical protein